jgi:hypothetical protein
MHQLKLYRSFLLILLVFAVIGTGLSFGAQRGGIGPLNGFIAPLIGPWSRCLEPNADRLKFWEAGNWLFAVSVTLITFLSVSVSVRMKKNGVRALIKVIAYLAVLFWGLCGIGKVLLEMT